MREERRWRGRPPGGWAVLLLLGLSACGLQPSGASGVPAASAAGGAGTSPGASPQAGVPIASPSPSPSIACDSAIIYLQPTGTFKVLPGATILVRVEGFPASTALTLTVAPMDGATAATPIGGTTTDAQGTGSAAGVIPADARPGDAIVQAMAGDGCLAMNYVFVVASLEGIGIDDDTVVPGQEVTMRAGGFLPESSVGAYLDGDPGDALCVCHPLAMTQTDAAGFAEIVVRIPRDVSPGDHVIVLAGADPDGASDLSMSVAITVDR